MINTNELMRGDLIYNHRHWACPVVEVFDDRVTVVAHHYGEETFNAEDLYPIDLDDDFFKKNGFIDFVANQMLFVDKENDLSICVVHDIDKALNGKKKYLVFVNKGNMSAKIPMSYVHEFQHLLSQAEVTMLLKVKEDYYNSEN
jgi:hypothetical protein